MTDLASVPPGVAVAGAGSGSRRTPPIGAVAAALVGGGPVAGEAIAVETGARSIAATGRRGSEVVQVAARQARDLVVTPHAQLRWCERGDPTVPLVAAVHESVPVPGAADVVDVDRVWYHRATDVAILVVDGTVPTVYARRPERQSQLWARIDAAVAREAGHPAASDAPGDGGERP